MWTKSLSAICLFIGAAATLGTSCDRFDTSRRAVIAKNPTWMVAAVGDLDAIGPAWGINLVRFELTRRDSPYASGELFQAGPHDLSFRDYYRDVGEWAARNAIRIRYRSDGALEPLRLTVRNDANVDVRWLRIRLTDILLVFELSPEASFDILTPHGMYPDLSIKGEWLSGKAIHGSAIVPEGTSDIRVTLRSDSVDVDFKSAE